MKTQLQFKVPSKWETYSNAIKEKPGLILGKMCPKALMHKQVQSSKQNVPGHWCT